MEDSHCRVAPAAVTINSIFLNHEKPWLIRHNNINLTHHPTEVLVTFYCIGQINLMFASLIYCQLLCL